MSGRRATVWMGLSAHQKQFVRCRTEGCDEKPESIRVVIESEPGSTGTWSAMCESCGRKLVRELTGKEPSW